MKIWNNENRTSFIIIASILCLVSLLWFAFKNPKLNPRLEKENYEIVQQWQLPQELNEISGIAWMEKGKLACVQDEDGIIFIYNLITNAVEQRVNFAKGGDYEGITLVDSTAYVLRSDGMIFEVSDFLSNDFEVNTFSTPFSNKNDMESLTIDKKNNRLLLIPKEKDLEDKEYLGIYGFDLQNKKLEPNPIMTILFNNPIFEKKEKKKKEKDKKSTPIHPADLDLNPLNGNLYIVEGKKPKILILDQSGKTVSLINLDKKTFNQPEGITFSPTGTMYISNEGKNGTANILEVALDK